jgi:hypothetical protein
MDGCSEGSCDGTADGCVLVEGALEGTLVGVKDGAWDALGKEDGILDGKSEGSRLIVGSAVAIEMLENCILSTEKDEFPTARLKKDPPSSSLR